MKVSLRRLTFSAMIAALTTITTVYLLHVPISIFGGQGCLHVGDAVIFLGASFLPTGYACAAAAVGGLLADLLCGSALWAPWTLIIKALIAFCFTAKGDTILNKQNYFALLAACLITIVGYYCAEGFIYGNWITPVYSIIGNLLQGIISSVLYVILGLSLDKAQIKKQIHL